MRAYPSYLERFVQTDDLDEGLAVLKRQIVKVDGIQERLYRISVQVTINDGRWRTGAPFSDIPLRK